MYFLGSVTPAVKLKFSYFKVVHDHRTWGNYIKEYAESLRLISIWYSVYTHIYMYRALNIYIYVCRVFIVLNIEAPKFSIR